MKNKVKIITIAFIILLVCLISFVGIYQRELNQMKNILPDYQFGMEFGGARAVRLDVKLGTETRYYDENGNEVEHNHEEGEEHSEEENLTEKQVPINSEEVLTSENYAKAKKIIKKRLSGLQVEEYQLRQDENGNFALEFKEDDNINTYIDTISIQGVFEIKDSQTNEVLLNNSNIKEARAVTYTGATGAVTVYLVIDFDEDGKAKLEEISKTYVQTTDEEGNTSTKNVLITIDDETIMNTYFGQTMSTGEIQIPIGSETTSGTVLSTYIREGQRIATILNSGVIPIAYEIGYNNSLTSGISEEQVQVMLTVVAIIFVVMIAYLTIRYKVKGLLAGISWIGFVAVVLLVLRYTNSIITANTLIAIAIVTVFNYIFMNALLHNKEEKRWKEIWLHYAILGIPMYIIAIVFSFGTILPISSFGIALFWASATMLIYNSVVTKNILEIE